MPVALAAVVVASCSAMASGNQETGRTYVAGDATVLELAPPDRSDPVEVSGTTVEGGSVSTERWRGSVVVLNLWYAACGPCRAEAPDLARVATETEPLGVVFLGINTRDGGSEAAAFQRTFAMPYPSVLDSDGRAVLALRGQTVPNAVPTTLVLDREGRVAARATGQVDGDVLRELVDQVLAEDGT